MTVKTKTATPTPEVSASEDAQHLAGAQASREAFAAAQALATKRQTDHDNAELAEVEMESQFSQGIDSATASDWSIAQAEVTRTEMLHDAAERAEKAAESAVISTDVTLAILAQPWVQSALKGVEVIPSFYVPKTSPDKPVAYVIQTVPSTDLGGGSVAGKVAVKYYRPSLYGALDAADIQAAAELAHCNVVVVAGGSQGYGDNGMKVDAVQVDVQRGQSPIPHISKDPTSARAGSHVAHTFAADLANSCRATTDPPVRAVNREYVGAAVTVKPLSGEVIGMKVDEAGVRATTVQLNLTYRREGDIRRTVNMEKHLKELLTDWQGSFVPSFGVVSSIKGRTDFMDPVGDTAVSVEAVFASVSR
jgi:hypothetical protein